MIRTATAFCLIILFTAPLAAQNCESVISLSKVTTRSSSDREAVEQAAASFCNEYSKKTTGSTSSNFGASYKLLAASYGSNSASEEEVASRFCSANSNYSMSKDAYRNYVENISPRAYGAYEQCIALSGKDLKVAIEENSILPRQFNMTASFAPTVSGSNGADLDYVASSGVTCKWNTGAARSIKMRGPSAAVLQCSRDDQLQAGFVTVVRTDEGRRGMTVPWQAYSKDGVPIDTIADLQAAIKSAQADNARLQNSLKAMRFECKTASKADNNVASAPEARIPDAEQADHVVTGGGCQTGLGSNGVNAILIESRAAPDGKGWRCVSGNQHNIATAVTTTAWVTYCRLASR